MFSDPQLVDIVVEVLSAGNTLALRVRGGSMHPFIRDEAKVQLGGVEPGAIACGDVILYRNRARNPVIHRVVKRRHVHGRLSFLTQGDAHPCCDSHWVWSDDIIGKVIAVEAAARWLRIESGAPRILNTIYARFLPVSRWLWCAALALASYGCSGKRFTHAKRR